MALPKANLTKFPNLYKTSGANRESRDDSSHSILKNLQFPPELLIIAWATLLREYTGEEPPVFFVDDGTVSVDLSAQNVSNVSAAGYQEAATAIRFVQDDSQNPASKSSPGSPGQPRSLEKKDTTWSSNTKTERHSVNSSTPSSPGASNMALILFHDLDAGSSRLESLGVVPSEHLHEIGLQLGTIIQQLTGFNDSFSRIDNIEGQLSIVNPFPKLIEGPRLLHELSFHHNLSSDLALDFKNSKGSRISISYSSLRHRSLLFAAQLRKCYGLPTTSSERLGVIPVFVAQSPELYVVLLAILQLGAAFCPLSLDTPEDRIKFIVNDVAAKVVATTAVNLPKLKNIPDIKCCVIDEFDNETRDFLKTSPEEINDREPSPNDLAYILYTSGSTGQPKGVALSHLAVTQSLLAHDPVIPHYSRFLQFASPTFDVSMFEIFFTFFRGNTVVGCRRKDLLNDLTGVINELEIDAAELTPTVAATLIRERRDVPKLNLLLTIGEMLTNEVVREFGSSTTQPPMLYGMYGPTEAAIHCTLEPEFVSTSKNGIIGRPLSTVSAFIAKPGSSNSSSTAIEILPVGHIGELVFGGNQLADGYLNREEQTNSVFIQHENYGRLYRTGDKGRMLPDGTLECLGRIEFGQVKLRGQRIELGEIEQAAMHTQGCRLCIARIIRDNLVVFCLVDGDDIQHEHIIESCRRWLLPYMMPNDVVFCKTFPQLPSGKIDKKALDASYDLEDNSAVPDSNAPENTELITQVCKIVGTILDCPVNATTDLVKTGLDSLRAIQMVSELRKQGFETDALHVLNAGNISSICSNLRHRRELDTTSFNETIRQLQRLTLDQPELKNREFDITEILPCTPLQASMLVETLKDPQAYCNWVELEFDSKLTIDLVNTAFTQLLEANKVLRSSFITIDDPSIGFAQIYWSQHEASQICRTDPGYNRDFNLDSASSFLRPLKIQIFEGSLGVRAVIQLHHALYDGWSLDLIIQDLDILLKGDKVFERPPFRRLTEYILSVSNCSIADDTRDYWEDQLGERQPDPFPEFIGDRSCHEVPSISTTVHELKLKKMSLASRDQFHPQVYFQTALSYLWAAYLGSTEVMLGCVSSSRTLPVADIENIVGPCISTLPLLVNVAEPQTIQDVLKTVHETNRQALQHSILPLQEIRKFAKINPGQPLFDVVFIWQESLETRKDSLSCVRQVKSADFLESKLLIEVEPRATSILIKASQRGCSLPESQVQALLEQICEIVESLADQTPDALAQLEISNMSKCISEKSLSSRNCNLQSLDTQSLTWSIDFSSATEILTCVISEDAEESDRSILPIGAMGRLSFSKDQVGSANNQDGTELPSFHHSKYGAMYLAPSVCRMHNDGSLLLLGNVEDYDWLQNYKVNLAKTSKVIKDRESVEDCFSLVTNNGVQQSIISFWVPKLASQQIVLTAFEDTASWTALPVSKELVAATEVIFEDIQQSLPAHLVPSFIIPINSMPPDDARRSKLENILASLSLDDYLGHFGLIQSPQDGSANTDRLGLEHEIADALSSTLTIPRSGFGRTTSFFRLGLDSISAISVARSLNKRVEGLGVDVASILQNPTTGRLAVHLKSQMQSLAQDSKRETGPFLEAETLESLRATYERNGQTVETFRRCTALQEGMLAASSKEAYYNYTLFKLCQDVSHFKRAFELMFKRHDILRTCFSSTEDPHFPFVQIVLDDCTFPWKTAHVASEFLDSTVEDIINQKLNALDTMRPPWLITQIDSEMSSYILLSMHHALYDGEAMAQLLLEVEMTLIKQELPTSPSFDAFLQCSIFKDFGEADAFWDRQLDGLKPQPLPQIDSAKDQISNNGNNETLVISERLQINLDDLERATQNLSVTIQTVLQSAWAKVLSIMFGTNDVCFGTVVSGRTLPIQGLDRLVAPCFNTIPVRIQLERMSSNRHLLRHMQITNAEAMKHQFTPLRRIQSRSKLPGVRLFDTLFILQRQPRKLNDSLWSMIKEVGHMGFPIVCEMIPDSNLNEIRLNLHVERAFIEPEHLKTVFDGFNNALNTTITDSQASVRNFDSHELRDLFSAGKQQRGASCEAVAKNTSNESIGSQNDEITTEVRRVISQFSNIPLDRIPPMKTIYQLGLDSISAIQVAKILRNAGFQVSSGDIMEGQTARGIASLIEQKRGSSVEDHFDFAEFDQRNRSQACLQHNIEESKVSSVRPCTQSQAGMVSQCLNSGGKTYLNHFLYKLDSDMNLEKLQDAWRVATENHEMLRTGFAVYADAKYSFLMIHYVPGAFELPWIQFSSLNTGVSNPSADPTAKLRQLRSNIAEQIFDQLEQPAWRLSIVCDETSGERAMQFSAHHALYDAESLCMIFDDVLKAYEDKPLQFNMSIEPLLDAILAGENNNTDSHKEFWQSKFHNPQINKFPDLNPLRVDQRNIHTVSIAGPNLSDIEQRCQNLGVSIQAALQVSWARLLSEYLGEAEITFGVVLAGRDSDGADDIPFPSTTTVPYHCMARKDIHSMLQDAMAYNASVRKHQHSPLTHIMRWAGSSSSSLFDTLLVFQAANDTFPGRQLWQLVDDEATVEYPLSLEITARGKGALKLTAVFWDDIIPDQHARLLLMQLVSTLEDTISDNGNGSIDIYSADQLSKLPPNAPELPSNITTLHRFVEEAAQRHPNRDAFEFWPNMEDKSLTRTWTYEELDNEGNKLANFILELGAKPRSLVAVCFDKCPEASFAILGVLKAGCAFIALDPSAPQARKSFIMDDSQANLVLTTKNMCETMRFDDKIKVVCVDSLNPEELKPKKPTTSDQVVPSDISYCLYTSGSTGTPKGCILSHENAVQAMLSFQRLFKGRWNESSRWLQFASFHFDVSVLEQFWSWSVGICVVSTPRDGLFADLPGVLQNLNITHIDLTPSLARLITPEQIPSLCNGVFITGGEPLKQEVLDAWGSTGVIHNGYGPTECTIGCTMYPRVPQNGKPSNIGWQFDNVGTYVFEPDTTRLVPRGAIGELCISGKLVGMGYLNRPETTAESFQYVEKYNERIYRTKDLVRMLHDGSFEFLGRCDDQVKLRGQRLELGEINSGIKNGIQVVEEVVTTIVKRSDNQSEQLVSFVVFDGNSSDWAAERSSEIISEIISVCQAKLPGYMVPSHIIPVESIPLTPNNKSDIKKLKDIFQDSLKGNSNKDNFQDMKTTGSHGIISQTLSDFLSAPLDTISPNSNVFELGLDSISVFGFCRALQAQGLGNVPPALIMESHTIGSLEKAFTKQQTSDSDERQAKQDMIACKRKYRAPVARRLGVSVQDVDFVYPCTPLQQGMIVRSLKSESRPYFNTFVYELKVNEVELCNALEGVSNEIPILRTLFVPIDQGYVQAVLRRGNAKKSMFKSMEATNERLWDSVDRVRQEWLEENQEVFRAPLQVVSLHHKQQLYMVFNIFHGLYDAIGLDLLMEKLAAKIQDPHGVTSDPLFHDALPFGPLKKVKGAESFWNDHMKGATFNQLSSQPVIASDKLVMAKSTMNDLDQFETLRRQLGITHQALIQAAWIPTLYSYLKAPTTIGIVVSGRSIPFSGAEIVIGPMFNTIPFFANVSQKETWKSLTQKCHNINVSALRFQHTPLRDIQKWCRPISDQGVLFDTLFVFQKPAYGSRLDTSGFWKELRATAHPDYPLSFEVEHTPEGKLNTTIIAQSHVMNDEACRDLLQIFETNLTLLLSAPEQLMSETIDVSQFVAAKRDISGAMHQNKRQSCGAEPFDWSLEALTLKRKIAELAGVDEAFVNERTSIFELGLDSIDAIKLSSAMKQEHLNLPVSAIIRSPSISQMTRLISSNLEASSTMEQNAVHYLKQSVKDYVIQVGLDLSEVEDVLPATPLQESLMAEMLSSDFENYFNHDVLKLTAEVDVEKLMQAIEIVCKSSPILRTGFLQIDNAEISCSFAQVVYKKTKPAWETINISESWKMDDVINRLKDEMISATADSASPAKIPLKFSYVLDGESKYFVLSIAHALYDGWSLALLHENIHKAYVDQTIPRSSYGDLLDQILRGDAEEAKNYWHDAVADTTGCRFPVRALGEDETRRHYLKEHTSSIPLSRIQVFCKSQDIGLQALGHLCWSFVLATYSRNLDVVFGVVLSGRDNEEAQQVLFPTMNTVVARSVISGSRMDMLKTMQANMADLMQYQHFPLRKVQALAQLAAQDFFNTLFIYQKRPVSSEITSKIYESVDSSSSVEYPVCVEMEIIDNALIWRTACEAIALSEEGTIKLLELLDHALGSIIQDPEASCVDFTGDEISICGLPAFTLTDSDSDSSSGANTHERNTAFKSYANLENAVRKVLAAVSKVPENEIRGKDTIFHLGLDSISLIKVSSLLRKQNLRITVSEIMKASAVENIVLVVEEIQSGQHDNDMTAIDPRETLSSAMRELDAEQLAIDSGLELEKIYEFLPATPAQVYFLTYWQNTAGTLFSPVFSYRMKGSVEMVQLRNAWIELVNRNPILRTAFIGTLSKKIPILQVVLHSPTQSFIELFPQDCITKATWDMLSPPVRLYARKSDAGDTELSLQIHHALYDAVSLPLLIEQLQNLCCEAQGRALHLDNNIFQKFLALCALPSAEKNRRRFWTEYLGSAETLYPPESIPTSKPLLDNTKRTEYYRPQSLVLSSEFNTRLRVNGISIQSIFLAACASIYSDLLLSSSRESRENMTRDVILGVYLANRAHDLGNTGRDEETREEEHNLAALAAPTLNLVPLRVKSPSKTPLLQSAQQIQANLQEISSLENASVGLWEIEEWTGIKIDCFVNFLRLPEDDNASTEDAASQNGNAGGGIEGDRSSSPNVAITPVSSDSGVPRDFVHDAKASPLAPSSSADFKTPRALESNAVKDTYLPSWDIEAAVREGALDIGIFGPAEVISDEKAERLVDEITTKLRGEASGSAED